VEGDSQENKIKNEDFLKYAELSVDPNGEPF
jgi:hypothetical protein